ncbi:predicted protein [Chaetoceros tenuissimus]|uniref:Uncharacterized protein n=1 Tax=Chaetoceros tenuissimus TaxID=426638 RepID=A0AAD3CN60_9STRA|nr:predicted protein [Chaetoceros tenuissimus]
MIQNNCYNLLQNLRVKEKNERQRKIHRIIALSLALFSEKDAKDATKFVEDFIETSTSSHDLLIREACIRSTCFCMKEILKNTDTSPPNYVETLVIETMLLQSFKLNLENPHQGSTSCKHLILETLLMIVDYFEANVKDQSLVFQFLSRLENTQLLLSLTSLLAASRGIDPTIDLAISSLSKLQHIVFNAQEMKTTMHWLSTLMDGNFFDKNKFQYLFHLPFLNFVTEIIDFLLRLEPCGEDIQIISLIAVEMYRLVSNQAERNTPITLHLDISVLTAKVSCLVIYCKMLLEKSHLGMTKWDQEPILEAEKSIVTSDFIIKVTWGLVSRWKEIQVISTRIFQMLFNEQSFRASMEKKILFSALSQNGYGHVLTLVKESIRLKQITSIQLEKAIESAFLHLFQYIENQEITTLHIEELVLIQRNIPDEYQPIQFTNFQIPLRQKIKIYNICKSFLNFVLNMQVELEEIPRLQRDDKVARSNMNRDIFIEAICDDLVCSIKLQCPPLQSLWEYAPKLWTLVSCAKSQHSDQSIVQISSSTFDAVEEYLLRIEFGRIEYNKIMTSFEVIVEVLKLCIEYDSPRLKREYLQRISGLISAHNAHFLLGLEDGESQRAYLEYILRDYETFEASIGSSISRQRDFVRAMKSFYVVVVNS